MKNLFFVYAIALQAITGLFVLTVFQPILVARLGFSEFIFSPFWGGILMIGSAALAAYGLIKGRVRYYYLFFIPQLFFMILSAASALSFIIQQQYADGVTRSWYFIFIDQLPMLLAVVLYVIALIQFEKDLNGE